MSMRIARLVIVCSTAYCPLIARLNTVEAVLEKYKQALGGVQAIKKVVSETRRGEIEATGLKGKATFIFYAKPFKTLQKITLPDGHEITSGFDGAVSRSISPQGASIDKKTPVESDRRDADLQYPLHQPDYFLRIRGRHGFRGSPVLLAARHDALGEGQQPVLRYRNRTAGRLPLSVGRALIH
jgi:hypothetical protein